MRSLLALPPLPIRVLAPLPLWIRLAFALFGLPR